jgi:hypothetical protein
MNMRKYAVTVTAGTLVCGAAGFLMRRAEVNTVFDEVTGLARSGAEASRLMAGFSVLVVLLAIGAAVFIRRRHVSPDGYRLAFAPTGLAYFLLLTALGLVWCGATAIHYLELRALGPVSLGETAFSTLSIASALSVILLAHGAYTGREFGVSLLLAVIPEVFFCYWLVFVYKQNQTNPVFIKYAYECLAITAATLSFYFITAYVYGKTAPARAVFSFITAVYFCAVALADRDFASVRTIIFAVVLICHAVNLARFVSNLLPRPAPAEDDGVAAGE